MIEPVVLFLVGVGIIALRTFARVRVVGWKHLESDDYIMFFVAVCFDRDRLRYSGTEGR